MLGDSQPKTTHDTDLEPGRLPDGWLASAQESSTLWIRTWLLPRLFGLALFGVAIFFAGPVFSLRGLEVALRYGIPVGLLVITAGIIVYTLLNLERSWRRADVGQLLAIGTAPIFGLLLFTGLQFPHIIFTLFAVLPLLGVVHDREYMSWTAIYTTLAILTVLVAEWQMQPQASSGSLPFIAAFAMWSLSIYLIVHYFRRAIRIEKRFSNALNLKLRQRARELEALADVSNDMLYSINLDTVLERITLHVQSLVLADTAVVFMPEPGGQRFLPIAARGAYVAEVFRHVVKAGEGILGDLVRQRQALLVNEESKDPRTVSLAGASPGSTERLIAAPLLAGDRVIGIMAAWRNAGSLPFTESNLKTLQALANQASIAVENARLFREAQQNRSAAEVANTAKSMFLANMSHELRTPLNAVLGFAQVLERDSSLGPTQREHVHIISRSGEHLLGLINDVLEMSKIEAGRATLVITAFDLHDLLSHVTTLFMLRARTKGILLDVEISPDVPRLVRGDEGKVRQIMINLLGNAVKFTEAGGVALRAGLAPTTNPGELTFMLEVEDSGPGIAPEQIDQLFQPFVQMAAGGQEGTGLGLAISQQFARLMSGEISVRSQLGQGSCFTVRVQLELATEAELSVLQRQRRPVGVIDADPLCYRLLVVDDKLENRLLMLQWLRHFGFSVRDASNGEEALEIWNEWQPQLIWMDMRMPVMDGYEATRRIKASSQGHDTVVIALTASAFEHEQQQILAYGCDDYVPKPVREETIVAKLEQHLGLRFLYQDELPSQERPSSKVHPAALRAIAPDLQAMLRNAVQEFDPALTLAAIERVRAVDPDLAKGLTALAQDYRFDVIENLLDAEQEAGPELES